MTSASATPLARAARRTRRISVLLTLAGCLVGTASAQGPVVPATAGWGSVRVPAGAGPLLAAAGLEPARPRATALLDIIRNIYDMPAGVVPAVDERRKRVVGYLDALAGYERARALFAGSAVRASGASDAGARGRLEALAEAIGASLDRSRGGYRLHARGGAPGRQRREALAAAGIDASKIQNAFNAGEAVDLAVPGEDLPMPLPEAAWRAVGAFAEQYAALPLAAVLSDRRASLLYLGSAGLDEETRQFFAASPELVRQVAGAERVPVFALYGRSFHVRQGRMAVPGGQAAAALWEDLAGESVGQPDRFILSVLEKDGGRLALLYDAVDHMEPDRQAFALGSWIDDAARRAARFRALYAACGLLLNRWEPRLTPFARQLYDPAHLLMLTPAWRDGRPGPLASRNLWARVFEGHSLTDRHEGDLATGAADEVLDAAGLLELVATTDFGRRREACETWLFGQRVFARVTREELPRVLVALRGRVRFRTLGATLERLDVTDPSIYAAAFVQAQKIADIGDPTRTAVALSLFQGALVLVERARLARSLDATAASRLIGSLSQVPLSDGGEFLGAVAAWIDAEFLPAVGLSKPADPASPDGGSLETRLLGALAGVAPGGVPVPPRTVEYEGMTYAVDPAAPDVIRLRDNRERQGAVPLDDVLALARAVRHLATGVSDPSRAAAEAAAIEAAAHPLLRPEAPDAPRDVVIDELRAAVAEAAASIAKMRTAADLAKVDRVVHPLARAVDRHLGRALTSLAYACSIGDPASTTLAADDPALHHDFGERDPDPATRLVTPWRVAEDSRDLGRWHMLGSLLALDVAFGAEALRRVSSEDLPGVPTITDNNRRALIEGVVLANALDYRDDDMARIAGAIQRGRTVVAALTDSPDRLPGAAAAAGLDDLRQQIVGWALAHEPRRVLGFFSLADLARIGGLRREALAAPDAWGTSGLSYDGRLGLQWPDARPYATLTGRQAKGLLMTLVPDLPLMAAEALSDERLPAVLTRTLLSVATLDYIERIRLASDDDWLTMISDVQRILPGRMADYLASAVTLGPLVPVTKKD